jgi:hypothetical protein
MGSCSKLDGTDLVCFSMSCAYCASENPSDMCVGSKTIFFFKSSPWYYARLAKRNYSVVIHEVSNRDEQKRSQYRRCVSDGPT